MPTIKDVAKKVSLSASTVSRVLNDDKTINVTDETKLKIFKAAEELSYKIPKKRNNQTNDNPNILIIDWCNESELLEDPFYLFLLTSVEKYCAKNNINYFKIIKVDDSYRLSADVLIDGVVAIGRFSDEILNIFKNFSNNIVFIDSSPCEHIYDSVVINFKTGIHEALDYLISNGHKKIAYIGGVNINSEKIITEDPRKAVFVDYIKSKNLFNDKYLLEGESLHYLEGVRLGKEIAKLEEKPTAIFIANDTMATGVLNAITELNIKVPEHISIIGFNDLPTSSTLNPSLTSVKVNTDFLAQVAVDILIQKIEGVYDFPRKVLIPTSLVIRESSGVVYS